MTTVQTTRSDRRANPDAPRGLRRVTITTILLLAGPLLLFAGYALHPDLSADTATALRELETGRTVYLVSKLMVAAGSLAMIPLIVAIRRRMIGERGEAVGTAGVVLSSIGLASNGLSQAVYGYLLWFATESGVEPAGAASVVDASVGADGLATLPISFLSVPLFSIGFLLVAVALWRTGWAPRWASVAIILATVAAGAIGVGVPMLAAGAVAVAGFAAALLSASPSAAG